MTATAPPQPTSPSGDPANQHDIDVRGNKNVVVTGDVNGDIIVKIGDRDVREQELAYLNWVVSQYRAWAEKYTPLAGIAEVRAATMNGPRLDLPMHFMPAGFEKLGERGYGELRQTEHIPVDDLRSAVAQYRRLVLLGEPGSGKTTTLRRLAYEYAEAALGDARAPLPVYVPLGEYAGPEPVLAHFQTTFGVLAADLPAYLASRRVVLLLDGLNEMPQAGYPERVGRIQMLLDLYPDGPVVVTCRALDYVETLRLEELEIKPLDPERQRAYLRRYLGEEDGEKLFWQLCGGEEILTLWLTWQRGDGSWEQFWTGTDIPKTVYSTTSTYQDELWKTLSGDGFPPLLALGRNPYMLVMLAQVYAAKAGVLPQNRGDLFGAFVDTLLAREQKLTDPAHWPGAEQLRSAMTHLAWSMQVAGERGTAVDRAWTLARLAKVCEPTQALYLCASASLLDDSGGTVRFVHQLLQEYFVALAMQEQLARSEDLRQYWPDDWTQPSGWEETFVLLAGMAADMTPLVRRLVDANPALAARCIAQSGGMQPNETTIRAVQQRLIALATNVRVPVAKRNAAGNALNHVGDPRPGVGVRADGVPDIVWCAVPAGEFIMGSTDDSESWGKETPQHHPDLAAFAISKYPITNAQFDAFVQDGGYTAQWRRCWTEAGWQWKGARRSPDKYGGVFNSPNHPDVNVTWYEAVAFCNWLSQKLVRSVSLPNEAQWERAARHTDGRCYPWGSELTPNHANYYSTGVGTTTAVGIFPQGASQCGALDMSGNVWEWTRSLWGKDDEKSSFNYPYDPLDKAREDLDAPLDILRVLRGGSFYDDAWLVRCAVRFRGDPNNRNRPYGFRVVVASP